jgi:hypothetical protein
MVAAAVKPRVMQSEGTWLVIQQCGAIGNFPAGTIIVARWLLWRDAITSAVNLSNFIWKEMQAFTASEMVN